MQFEDLIRSCDRDDLDTLWRMVNDRHNARKLQDNKEKELWVHFRRLYEPDPSDRFWKFQAFDQRTLWKIYDSCNIHHISTQEGVDVFMLAEREYPLRAGVLDVLISTRLRCEERTEVVNDLVQRIYNQNRRESAALRRR